MRVDNIVTSVSNLPQKLVDHINKVSSSLRVMLRDTATLVYFSILSVIIFLGIVGPYIAPYETLEIVRQDGQMLRSVPPSLAHPLGTTNTGYDVFSQVLIGARPTVVSGILGGTIIISIGMAIGLVAGYLGGWVDDILMRLTDFAYGIPVLPTAIVLAALLGIGYYTTIVIIGFILWRSSARVIRSQVLQIKEQPYIKASVAAGASNTRIIVAHIIPNVLPMAIIFFSVGIGVTILIQAGLAFIGVVDPTIPSWGVIIRQAFRSGEISVSWWWGLPAGFLLSLTVLCTFMFGRSVERILGETDEESLIT